MAQVKPWTTLLDVLPPPATIAKRTSLATSVGTWRCVVSPCPSSPDSLLPQAKRRFAESAAPWAVPRLIDDSTALGAGEPADPPSPAVKVVPPDPPEPAPPSLSTPRFASGRSTSPRSTQAVAATSRQ